MSRFIHRYLIATPHNLRARCMRWTGTPGQPPRSRTYHHVGQASMARINRLADWDDMVRAADGNGYIRIYEISRYWPGR